MRSYLFLAGFIISFSSFAQVRTTVQSGPWNVGATWSGGIVPTAANSTSIVIAHDVNVPSGFSVTIDQATVNQGITLTVDAGGTLTIGDDGTGAADLDIFNSGGMFGFVSVSGTLILANNATILGSSATNVDFDAGSVYRHTYVSTEGSIPLATWDPASTVEITGYKQSFTATAGGNWGQSFGNFVYNCTGQVYNSTVNFAGLLTTIAGDLNFLDTNGGPSSQGRVILAAGESPTITIGGDYTIEGSSRIYCSTAPGTSTLNVGGNFTVTSDNNKGYGLSSGGTTIMNVAGDYLLNAPGGRFDLAITGGSATLDLDGDFTFQSGTFNGNGTLQFSGVAAQNYSAVSTFSGAVNYIVTASATLDLGTSIAGGSGSFTVQGTLRLGSLEPLGAIVNNESQGNVRTPVVSRSFASGSRIVYNGAAAQFIGAGHPSSNGVFTEIMNASGVSLAAAVTLGGDLVLTTGALSIGSLTLTLNAGASATGGNLATTSSSNLTINGTGAFGNIPFPAGSQSIRNLTINRTGGSVTLANDLDIVNILTLTSGNLVFSNRTLTLSGTLSRTGGLLESNSSATLVISGTGALGSSLSFSGSGNVLQTLTMNKSGGSATVSGTLTISVNLNLFAGNLVNSGGLSLSNGATITRSIGVLQTNRVSNLAGESYNLVYTNTSNIVAGLELPDPANTEDLNNLTISGSATVTLNQNLTVSGSATFNSGNFQVGLSSPTVTMEGGSWTVNGGTFTPASGTIVFNGSTTLGGSGTPSFYIFTVNNGATVNMPAGNVNVGHTFTLNATATFAANSGTITFNGAAVQNVSANGKTFANLTVNKTGGTLNFTSAASLSGTLTIQSATTVSSGGNLTLLSTSDGATGNASIGPIPAGATVSGNLIIQRFMSDEGVINRYISIPSSNIPVSQLQDDFSVTGSFTGTSFPCTGCTQNGNSIRYYNETTLGDFSMGYTGFPSNSNTETFTAGRGYLAFMWEASPLNPKVVNMDVTGSIVQGTFDYSSPVDLISRTNSGQPQFDDDDGWNLIGNPYPSSIVWSNNVTQWTNTDIAPTIFITDNPAGVFRSWNANTSVGDIPGGRIAASQAFWVYANTSGAALSVHEPAKTATTGVFFRTQSSETTNLKVSLTHNGVTDNSFLVVHPSATPGFDANYDAIKPRNPVFDVAFHHESTGKSLVMQTVPDVAEEVIFPLVIRTTEPGEYSLAFMATGQVGDLFLIDSEFEVSVPVSDLTPYSFSITSAATLAGRFYLSTTPGQFEKNATQIQQVSVYPNPVSDVVFVRAGGNGSAEASIISTTGQVFYRHHMDRGNDGRFASDLDLRGLPTGVYIVRVTIDGVTVNRKIIKN